MPSRDENDTRPGLLPDSQTKGSDEMTTEGHRIISEAGRELLAEMERAETIHPNWPDDTIHQAAVVSEEAGEALQAALNAVYHASDPAKIRKEIVHTGAMCLRWLKNNYAAPYPEPYPTGRMVEYDIVASKYGKYVLCSDPLSHLSTWPNTPGFVGIRFELPSGGLTEPMAVLAYRRTPDGKPCTPRKAVFWEGE
jgi:hypothetical protein